MKNSPFTALVISAALMLAGCARNPTTAANPVVGFKAKTKQAAKNTATVIGVGVGIGLVVVASGGANVKVY